MILAGDIGGTNTRLALFDTPVTMSVPAAVEVFPSKKYRGLEEVLETFRGKHSQPIEAAAFGIAGPVLQGRCQTPNLPWVVDAASVSAVLRLESIDLVNDLEANAHGISLLGPDDFEVLQPGVEDPQGNRALISAGTGLGEAGFVEVDGSYIPYACEGGHCDFAARNEIEIELLRYLLARFGRVSYERVLSGPGLFNIYQFLRDTGRGEEPAWLAEELRQVDPPVAISKNALSGRSALCVLAMDQFVCFYGAEAGNLALKAMATGGVFLGGGIAPRILPKLKEPGFLAAFADKGRISQMLKNIPVRVVLNDKTALMGAGLVASRRVHKTSAASASVS